MSSESASKSKTKKAVACLSEEHSSAKDVHLDWKAGRLGDFIELKRGYDLPKAQRIMGEFALVSSSGVTDRHALAMVKGPGVVTGRYGTIGQVFYIEKDFWPLNTTLYVRDFKGNDPKFISYFLQTLNFSAYSDKAAVPGINRNDLHQAAVVIPPLSIQIATSQSLGVLDDRISLLRETNATLAAIAQALFKSWFVDFDPVHAKAEGRVPEMMDEATAALFPDSFEVSKAGLIPRGWRSESIYSISQVTYGAPFSSKRFNSDGVGKPLIRIRDLKDELPGIFTDEVHPKGYVVQPGDIVVGMDGEFRAYLWGGDAAWLNQRVCVFHALPKVPTAFVHQSLIPLLAAVEASETATTVIHLGKNDIDRFEVVVPTPEVLECFAKICAPLYEKIVLGKEMASSLIKLRDSLLPRLIFGKLHAPDAEALLQDAA